MLPVKKKKKITILLANVEKILCAKITKLTYAIPVYSYLSSVHIKMESRFSREFWKIVAPIGTSSERECHIFSRLHNENTGSKYHNTATLTYFNCFIRLVTCKFVHGLLF